MYLANIGLLLEDKRRGELAAVEVLPRLRAERLELLRSLEQFGPQRGVAVRQQSVRVHHAQGTEDRERAVPHSGLERLQRALDRLSRRNNRKQTEGTDGKGVNAGVSSASATWNAGSMSSSARTTPRNTCAQSSASCPSAAIIEPTSACSSGSTTANRQP